MTGQESINYPIYVQFKIKLQSFQYKILQRKLVTNKLLIKTRILNNENSGFCSYAPVTIKHIFWFCKEIHILCDVLSRWINQKTGIYIIFGKTRPLEATGNELFKLGKWFNYHFELTFLQQQYSSIIKATISFPMGGVRFLGQYRSAHLIIYSFTVNNRDTSLQIRTDEDPLGRKIYVLRFHFMFSSPQFSMYSITMRITLLQHCHKIRKLE